MFGYWRLDSSTTGLPDEVPGEVNRSGARRPRRWIAVTISGVVPVRVTYTVSRLFALPSLLPRHDGLFPFNPTPLDVSASHFFSKSLSLCQTQRKTITRPHHLKMSAPGFLIAGKL